MTPPSRPGGDPVADDLRSRCREARRRLPAGTRADADAAIAGALVRWCRGGGAPTPGALATYLPTDGEADPGGAHADLRAAGWELFLPVLGPDRSMSVAPWPDGAALAPNRFGVHEPVDRTAERPVASMDVVLVPSVALDRRGNRLGFGAGYYDRALASVGSGGRPLLIGVAYEVQVVERVPVRPWDVAVGLLLTERGLRPAEAVAP